MMTDYYWKHILLAGVMTLLGDICYGQNAQNSYKNPSLPVEERVEDLLSRMTIEEKVAQLRHIHSHNMLEGQELDIEKLADFCKGISWGCAECFPLTSQSCVENVRKIQEYVVNETRLGIPLLIVTESLHGCVQDGCTIYPQNIALGSTFNPDLAYRKAASVSGELHKMNFRQVLAPDVDVVRDLRWGRVEEAYGEDPILVGQMGVNEVLGYMDNGISPMPKHYGAHGNPLGGLNLASVDCGTRDLFDIYLKPFEMIFTKTPAMTIMSSYNSCNRVPNSASAFLMNEVLRERWGFKGFVYSDWGAVSMLRYFHRVAENEEDAALMALNAGLDLEASSEEFATLIDAVKEGRCPIGTIDEAVRRVLRVKFSLGLFENPYGIEQLATDIHSKSQVALAKEIADESIVLLQNKDNLLPLDASRYKSIAVIGPLADRPQFGDYSWGKDSEDGVTPLEGIRSRVGKDVEIKHIKGCSYSSLDTSEISEAARCAAECELTILICGSSGSRFVRSSDAVATTGEGMDLHNISLTGAQEELVRAVASQGKPLVFVLVAGKPFAIPWEKENLSTILLQWYGGEEAGNALADVLFGNVNPSGKLNYSFPQSTGHLPAYYNHLPSDKGFYKSPGTYDHPGRDYVFSDPSSLWNFGHGLSYTTFEYLSATSNKKSYDFEKDESIKLSVKVKNTGNRDGKEVVQAYVRDVVSSTVMPIRELKAFRKVAIKAGETKEMTLEIPLSELSLTDEHGFPFFEDGDFLIEVGGASDNIAHTIRIYAGKNEAPKEKSAKTAERVANKPVGKMIKVSGMVRDIQSTPVSGVKIHSAWSGEELGTTDKEGRFTVSVRSDDSLVFKYKDKEKTKVQVDGKRKLSVKLL